MESSKAPHEETTGVSDATVKAKTGRTWHEWFALLDKDGAASLDRRGIATIISGKYGIGSLWRQIITVAYERARDLRQATERVGELGVKATRTINAPVHAIYVAVTDAAKRNSWMSERLDQLRKTLNKRPAT
jgi:hypothetical protein